MAVAIVDVRINNQINNINHPIVIRHRLDFVCRARWISSSTDMCVLALARYVSHSRALVYALICSRISRTFIHSFYFYLEISTLMLLLLVVFSIRFLITAQTVRMEYCLHGLCESRARYIWTMVCARVFVRTVAVAADDDTGVPRLSCTEIMFGRLSIILIGFHKILLLLVFFTLICPSWCSSTSE